LSVVYFEVHSKLCRRIRVSRAYWNYIVGVKHRAVRGLEDGVKGALINPVELGEALGISTFTFIMDCTEIVYLRRC